MNKNLSTNIWILVSSYSAINSSLALSKTLKKNGFNVNYMGDEQYKIQLEKENFHFIPLDWMKFYKKELKILNQYKNVKKKK